MRTIETKFRPRPAFSAQLIETKPSNCPVWYPAAYKIPGQPNGANIYIAKPMFEVLVDKIYFCIKRKLEAGFRIWSLWL